MQVLGGQGGIFKSCPRVSKLWIWPLRGWGRCLNVAFQICAPTNFRWCRWGAERRVERAQTREQGPPSVPAEIIKSFYQKFKLGTLISKFDIIWILKLFWIYCLSLIFLAYQSIEFRQHNNIWNILENQISFPPSENLKRKHTNHIAHNSIIKILVLLYYFILQ